MNNPKLHSLLEYVCQKVPFYIEHFQNKTVESLEDMPVISKQFMKDNYDQFVSQDIDWNNCSVEYTSGSTGQAFKCVKSLRESFLSQRKMWKLRSELLPDAIDKRLLVFSNSFSLSSQLDVDSTVERKNSEAVQKSYYGQLDLKFLTPRDISEQPLDLLVKFIKEYQPDWIRATPSNIYYFCTRLYKSKEWDINDFNTIKMIEVSGENLGVHERELIEKTFGCKVINHYGAREIWPIAYECNCGNMHIEEDHVICELINTDLYEDGMGEICLTALNQKMYPFIRYAIGDIGRIKRINCSCGKEGLILERIEGRVGKMVHIDNKIYSSKIFSQMVKELVKNQILEIGNFEIIQQSEYAFDIRLELLQLHDKNYEEYILTFLQNNLSPKIKVNVLLCEQWKGIIAEKNQYFHSNFK